MVSQNTIKKTGYAIRSYRLNLSSTGLLEGIHLQNNTCLENVNGIYMDGLTGFSSITGNVVYKSNPDNRGSRRVMSKPEGQSRSRRVRAEAGGSGLEKIDEDKPYNQRLS